MVATSVLAAPAARSLWSRLRSVPVEYPFAFGVVFSGFKTSFSDLLVQKVVERREKVDWKRNAAFAAFGFVYLGGVQYAIYVPFFSRIFPTAKTFTAKSIRDKMKDFRGMFECVAQVFIDQMVHHPLMYFPAFYCTKELVMQEKPDLMRCLKEYQGNMQEDLLALWKIWIPATLVNFAFMPMWARIPTVATTSLVWTCVLSAMRGGDVSHADDMAGGAVTGETFQMMEEGLGSIFTQRPAELDANKSHIMITAAGADKPGWVAQVSRAVADAGGSITHSRMARLGDDWTISMHAAVPVGQDKEFTDTLTSNKELEPLQLNFRPLTRRATAAMEIPQIGIRLRAVGEDRPAMLASISEVLVKKGLSIETVHTELKQNRQRRDFVVEADCVANKFMDNNHVNSLVQELNHIKKDLVLDTLDVRVQRLRKPRYSSTQQ